MNLYLGNKKSFWKKNSLYFFLFSLVWLFAFYMLTVVLKKGEVILYFSANRGDNWNYFFRFCTKMGEGYPPLVALIVLLWVHYAKSLIIFLNGSFVLIVTSLLKSYFGHERPSRYFQYLNYHAINYVPDVVVMKSWTSSFPSGHTSFAFAFYSLLAFMIPYKSVKILCLIMAILVGVSRMYLVQHFLKGVVSGAILGVFIALLSYWFLMKIEKKITGNLKFK